jgi:hypothetical protein
MTGSEIVEYLQDRVGSHLRGVIRYHQESTDILYLRDDVHEVRLQSQFDRIVDRLEPESHSAEERAFPFGDLYVTVRRFEEAIIMHFPTGHNRGIIVSLEPETARNLNTFTTECLKRIE